VGGHLVRCSPTCCRQAVRVCQTRSRNRRKRARNRNTPGTSHSSISSQASASLSRKTFSTTSKIPTTPWRNRRHRSEIVLLVGALNRSPVYDTTYKGLPVIASIREAYPEYEQDDPAVAADIAAGKLELEVKKNWARLCALNATVIQLGNLNERKWHAKDTDTGGTIDRCRRLQTHRDIRTTRLSGSRHRFWYTAR
jgi:hypothetical protein